MIHNRLPSLIIKTAISILFDHIYTSRLPSWLSGKEFACNAGATGDVSFISGSGRSPGGEHGNPLQYSCLENPMDRGAWQATVQRVAKSDMTEAT